MTLRSTAPLRFWRDRSPDPECSTGSAVAFSGRTLRSCCTRGFQLTERMYAAERQNPIHTHANAYVEVTLKGQFILCRGQKKQTCLPWTINYHPPGELHSSHYVPGSGTRIMIIEIDGQELRWIRDFCSLTEDSLVFDGGRQSWPAARVYKELLHLDEVSPIILEGLVLELLGEILGGRPFKSVEKVPVWLVRAEELIQARFLEPLSLSEIAKEVGIHPVNLAHEYRRRFHRTIGSHMRQLRIEKASRQIVQTDLPIVEIALASGFSDQSSFTVAFKNVTGITPSAYRNISRPANRSKDY